jgi:hypothetical protein
VRTQVVLPTLNCPNPNGETVGRLRPATEHLEKSGVATPTSGLPSPPTLATKTRPVIDRQPPQTRHPQQKWGRDHSWSRPHWCLTGGAGQGVGTGAVLQFFGRFGLVTGDQPGELHPLRQRRS